MERHVRPGADEDRQAVSACQKGNTDAFETLVKKYQKKMLNIAYRMTGDYEEACEVVQEAFLSAYRAIRAFRGHATFSTWLYAITMNHARNHLRQTTSRARHEQATLDDPVETPDGTYTNEPHSHETTALEQLERQEIQQEVQECISALDEDYREVLILRDVQGFSYEEISDILKLPDGTVKSRLFRARDMMRERLKRKLGDL